MKPPPRDALDAESFEGLLVAGKYRVERLVGNGGMGTVWRGTHTALGTSVAIKFIRPQFAERGDARRRFEIEARAAATVSSRHAVKVYDCGIADVGLPYIVMEYLEGEALSETLERRGPMEAHEVAKIVREAARALARAHEAGIGHRDLKPDNIVLATNAERETGETYVVKLVDFGIAKILDVDVEEGRMGGPTLDGAVVGTPNFMTPEQLTVGGAPTPATDIWALAMCAFSAFTARLAVEGEVLGDIVLKVCSAPLPVPSRINPRVPRGLDAWFARACNRDPAQRFQTAEALALALDEVCGVRPAASPPAVAERVQYKLIARPEALAELEGLQVSSGMSARTALLAGLVIGVTAVVGIVGALAYRSKVADEATRVAPAASPADARAPRR